VLISGQYSVSASLNRITFTKVLAPDFHSSEWPAHLSTLSCSFITSSTALTPRLCPVMNRFTFYLAG
jgi:hypothetical protein